MLESNQSQGLAKVEHNNDKCDELRKKTKLHMKYKVEYNQVNQFRSVAIANVTDSCS